MMKMLIRMDEGKIVQEGKYDLEKINAYLTKVFAKRNMKKTRMIGILTGTLQHAARLS